MCLEGFKLVLVLINLKVHRFTYRCRCVSWMHANYCRFACWSLFYMSTIYRQCTNKYDNSISCSNDNTLKCLRSKINVYLQHNNNRSKCILVFWYLYVYTIYIMLPENHCMPSQNFFLYYSLLQMFYRIIGIFLSSQNKNVNVPNPSWRQVNDGKLSW